MYFALGAAAGAAASTALDLLSSLGSKLSNSASTGIKSGSSFRVAGPESLNPIPASGGAPNLSPATFNALLAAQDGTQTLAATSPSDSLKDLLTLLDGSGDGKISKAEFEDKLGAGGTNIKAAEDVFAKLDANNDGSVTLDEMSSALRDHRAATAAHSYNLVEQLTETQANGLSTAAKRSVSLNV
jgi:Ca2+-binding EF-hand superfamily protein